MNTTLVLGRTLVGQTASDPHFEFPQLRNTKNNGSSRSNNHSPPRCENAFAIESTDLPKYAGSPANGFKRNSFCIHAALVRPRLC
jgi:hypothetical protein